MTSLPAMINYTVMRRRASPHPDQSFVCSTSDFAFKFVKSSITLLHHHWHSPQPISYNMYCPCHRCPTNSTSSIILLVDNISTCHPTANNAKAADHSVPVCVPKYHHPKDVHLSQPPTPELVKVHTQQRRRRTKIHNYIAKPIITASSSDTNPGYILDSVSLTTPSD